MGEKENNGVGIREWERRNRAQEETDRREATLAQQGPYEQLTIKELGVDSFENRKKDAFCGIKSAKNMFPDKKVIIHL